MAPEKKLDAKNAYLARLLKHGPREGHMPVLQRLRAKEGEIIRLRRCLAISGDGRISELLTQLDEAHAVIENMKTAIQVLWNVGCGTAIPDLEPVVQETTMLQPGDCS